MIRDLECRVKAKEGELQLLRRSFEDNEKALHMVRSARGARCSTRGGCLLRIRSDCTMSAV